MNVDLNGLSIPQLRKLIQDAEKEIGRKEQVQVREVRSKMEELASSVGMSLEEVITFGGRPRKSGRSSGVVRYRNPANPDQTWSGRGKQPNWLKEALEKGASKEDFAV